MSGSHSRGKTQIALLRLLVNLKLIDGNQSVKELEQSEWGPIAFFAQKGLYDEKRALEMIATELRIPLVFLEGEQAKSTLELLDRAPLSQIAVARWREMRAMPVESVPGRIALAMANPLDQETRRSLEFELGSPVVPALASEEQILALAEKKLHASPLFDVQTIFRESGEELVAEQDDLLSESTILVADPQAAPVVRLVNKIFSDAIEAGASDIHFTPEQAGLSVRVRIDGIMHGLIDVPEQLKNAVTSRIKLLGAMDISERRKPQDGRLRLNSVRGQKDLRLSSVPTAYGENLVIRILSSDLQHTTFESLGMNNDFMLRMQGALQGSSRVVLVSGPTGSGKSSTLYAALNSVADGSRNIITVEDPVEYRIPGITQIQVNAKIGVTFAQGLRSILRQDPDVIMVGEIRDQETAEIAAQAAQTGHLVLSTIHTNTAAATVTRLLDLGLPAYLIASSVGTIIAQRLSRKLCNECATPTADNYMAHYAHLGLGQGAWRQAVGCAACKGTGYKGRTAIFSILDFDDRIRDAVRTGMSEKEIETLAVNNGFLSLEQAGLELARSGVTSLDEIERVLGALGSEALAAGTRTLTASQSAAAHEIAKRRILLVEDDEDTRAVLSLLLKGEMFDVEEAGNGQEGLDKVYAHVPELILCDLMMPKMDGTQMVDRLRKDPRTRHIPVLMLTAADSEENEIKALNHGADDFVSKTSDTKVMLSRIYRLLDRAAG